MSDPTRKAKLPVYPLLTAEMRKRVAHQRAYPIVPTRAEYHDVPAVLREIGILANEKGSQ